jgi:hypothetical protein
LNIAKEGSRPVPSLPAPAMPAPAVRRPKAPAEAQADTVDASAFKRKARSLDRVRVALRFSLWTWALYWPGGGLLLLYGGLDPISIAVTLASLASFVLLLATGALKADASRNMKEFFLERPLYLVAGLIALIVLAAIVPTVEGFALLLFAAAWFGGLGLAAKRLAEHVREEGTGFWRSRADQLLITFVLAGFFSLLVLLDALLPLMNDGDTLGSPSGLVAVSTWANLLYPAFVLIASRPFREPLKWPRRGERAPKPGKEPAARPFRAS